MEEHTRTQPGHGGRTVPRKRGSVSATIRSSGGGGIRRLFAACAPVGRFEARAFYRPSCAVGGWRFRKLPPFTFRPTTVGFPKGGARPPRRPCGSLRLVLSAVLFYCGDKAAVKLRQEAAKSQPVAHTLCARNTQDSVRACSPRSSRSPAVHTAATHAPLPRGQGSNLRLQAELARPSAAASRVCVKTESALPPSPL